MHNLNSNAFAPELNAKSDLDNLSNQKVLTTDKPVIEPVLIAGKYPGYPGVPGVVQAIFNPPPIAANGQRYDSLMVGEDVLTPRGLDNLGVTLRGTYGDKEFATGMAALLAKDGGTSIVLQEVLGYNNHTEAVLEKGKFSVYAGLNADKTQQVQEIFAGSKNNIVDFTRKLSEAGGSIGESMREAWQKGSAFALALAAILFEIGRQAVFGDSRPQSNERDGKST